MATMKAVRWYAEKGKVEMVEASIPELDGPDNVLIKMVFCGICGTDLHIMQKEFAGTWTMYGMYRDHAI